MPAQPCAFHPSELTLVRCGRCDRPICTRCMVDSPVGKKCRDCARSRTHLTESSARHAALAFLAALCAAVPAGWMMHQIIFLPILAFPYGWVVGEVALRAAQRRRSLAIQVVVGLAALLGSVTGSALVLPGGPAGEEVAAVRLHWEAARTPFALIMTGLGTAAAVWRVRYL